MIGQELDSGYEYHLSISSNSTLEKIVACNLLKYDFGSITEALLWGDVSQDNQRHSFLEDKFVFREAAGWILPVEEVSWKSQALSLIHI